MSRQPFRTDERMTFSRAHSKIIAIEIKVRRAKSQARHGHPDLKMKHADWCRDAEKENYISLTKSITDNCKSAQLRNEKFRSQLHAIK